MDLRTSGVVITPRPVKGRDGELIQSVGHPLMRRPRNVVLFDWEAGVRAGHRDEDLASPFETLGEVTARMHLHSRQWRRPEGFERLTWDFETSIGKTPHWGRWQDGMGLDSGKRELFSRATALSVAASSAMEKARTLRSRSTAISGLPTFWSTARR